MTPADRALDIAERLAAHAEKLAPQAFEHLVAYERASALTVLAAVSVVLAGLAAWAAWAWWAYFRLRAKRIEENGFLPSSFGPDDVEIIPSLVLGVWAVVCVIVFSNVGPNAFDPVGSVLASLLARGCS